MLAFLACPAVLPRTLTFALAQMRCEKAGVAEILAAIARVYQQADQPGATIVACPDMSLSSYIDPARQPQGVLRLDGPEVAALIAVTAKCRATLLAGLVEANPHGKPYITHIAARPGNALPIAFASHLIASWPVSSVQLKSGQIASIIWPSRMWPLISSCQAGHRTA